MMKMTVSSQRSNIRSRCHGYAHTKYDANDAESLEYAQKLVDSQLKPPH